MASKIIVLEGLDGSGKSTQSNLVKNFLEKNGFKYEYFHFPAYGHNQFSDVISKFLRGEFGKNDEVDPLFVANIYAMDRFRFLPVLEKSIAENDVILLDRYVYSNIAYQCAKFTNDEDIETMKDWIFEFEFGFLKLPYPDLNIFLDIPNEISEKRLNKKREGEDREYLQGKQDIHEENLSFQEKVRNNYLNVMSGAPNCKIISCVENNEILTPEKIFENYKEFINLVL